MSVHRVMVPVVDARPPNYDQIVAVLPGAAAPGVMFAVAGKVYYPGSGGKPLTRELDAHEGVHLSRQLADDKWWDKYLADTEFRYIEELVAHRAEYQTYCKRHINPVKRAQFARMVARRLASPLYNIGLPFDQVLIDVTVAA